MKIEEIKLDNGIIETIEKLEEDCIVIKLLREEKGIIGFALVDNNAKVNNIYVEVKLEHRSNGYGMFLFNEALKEYSKYFDKKELEFKIMNRNLINIIISKSGGLQIDNDDGIYTYIVPLNK